jgi:type II secretory ATPase GspE/PulE/Tfp pilus assembly ATPase PilB-like protein
MSDWKSFPTKTMLPALAAGYSSLSVAGTNTDPDWAPSKACSTITHHDVIGANGRKRSISGRFTSRPTVDSGCKVAIRLLDTDVRDVRIPSLIELGFEHSHVNEQLTPALQKNQGLILLAGGTGSGKSTTLRTLMHDLPDKESLERYSVEDPVEYVLPGVIQLSIQRGSDESEESTRLKFTAALRDLMRMDPDAVMIGEIRDGETARLATEMVNTGHRVLSTVHGNGNIDVLDRLTGATLGVSSNTLASSSYLLCVVYQKLLPKLCPKCKQPAKGKLTPQQAKAVVQRFGLDPATLFVANPTGCEHCNLPEIAPSGTNGLTVVAEVMTTDQHILDLIREMRWNAARDYWRSQRRTGYGDPDMTGKTALEHAIYKMSRGLVSINDIERDFEPLATYPLLDLEAAHGMD